MAIEPYLDIQRLRFPDWLRITYDIAGDTLDCLVPRFVLQPLVENAILHGIQPALHGGTVEIAARRAGGWLEVEVSDDGVGLPADAVERVGLTNCRERLTTYFGEEQALILEPRTPAGTRVALRLPWITAPREEGHVVVD